MWRLRLMPVALAACGAGDSGPPPTHWTWSFRDSSTGQTVACPPLAKTIEISTWSDSGIGHSCSDTVALARETVATFPCSAGEAEFLGRAYTRFDVTTGDGRVYARFEVDANQLSEKHIEITTPRGFVQLTVARIDPTTMLERPCMSYEAIDSPWLGPTETIDCYSSARTTVVLPGQDVGMKSVEATLQSHNRCEAVFARQASDVLVEPDATADVFIQLSP